MYLKYINQKFLSIAMLLKSAEKITGMNGLLYLPTTIQLIWNALFLLRARQKKFSCYPERPNCAGQKSVVACLRVRLLRAQAAQSAIKNIGHHRIHQWSTAVMTEILQLPIDGVARQISDLELREILYLITGPR